MTILLDTHIFLWYISADPRLPATHRMAIQDPANAVFLSMTSIWEAVIKHQIGRRPLPAPPAQYLPRLRDAHRIAPLLVDDGAMGPLAGLPPIHRDPFDRMLVAQAIQHGMTLATVDPDVIAYPVPSLPTGNVVA